MQYNRAPIVEAVLEFRWSPHRTIEELKSIFSLPVFDGFETPKPRHLINASIDIEEGELSQDRRQVGFEASQRDGSEIVLLECDKFVYVRRAPYDCWKNFSTRALELLKPIVGSLNISDLVRIGVRFVNRIDVPLPEDGNLNTDDYITIKFNGPRNDAGIIDEFQMRLVKPTTKKGIAYALMVATSSSPLPSHGGILLDIDVFTRKPVSAFGPDFSSTLSTMHDEKNDIFERCITDKSRKLFGGLV